MTTSNSDLAEYTDAEEYDRENGTSGPDLDYYLDLARTTSGPGLDLACGTGFLTIPFARLGLTMVGVDRGPEMLALARRKAGTLPIRWVQADCRTLDLGAQ
ncbi:MAG: class I SAM-dependent methyltransferase, partial [Thermomicrobiales bacterium]